MNRDGSLLVTGLVNVAIGLLIAVQGAARHRPWGGAVNTLLGALCLAWWWTGGGRDQVKRAIGAKSAALRAALVQRVRELSPGKAPQWTR